MTVNPKSEPGTMLAARLHGPRDLRLEPVSKPAGLQQGEVLLRVSSTGICGSDLHSYADARIGDTPIQSPLVLGHEFSGIVESVEGPAMDGGFKMLERGMRVAVDPAQPCHHCELCEQGHPNLCCNLKFCSNHPYDGSLSEWMKIPARCCFPVPDQINDEEAALLEPLGVGIHATDLARIRVADSVAILGAGSIGLSILQLARMAGAVPVYITDRHPWRLKVAEGFGGIPISCLDEDPVKRIRQETKGRGVDIVIEAAWGDESVEQAAEMVRLGGRLVLAGIPSDDRLCMKHSTARRKGLTIRLVRRMKHTYPRAIELASRQLVDLSGMISHRFSLAQAAEAFQMNADYRDNVVKVVINNKERH